MFVRGNVVKNWIFLHGCLDDSISHVPAISRRILNLESAVFLNCCIFCIECQVVSAYEHVHISCVESLVIC